MNEIDLGIDGLDVHVGDFSHSPDRGLVDDQLEQGLVLVRQALPRLRPGTDGEGLLAGFAFVALTTRAGDTERRVEDFSLRNPCAIVPA